MFQKRMQRAAIAMAAAALLLGGPVQAAGWTAREAPGLLGMAWEWLVERVSPQGISAASGIPAPLPPPGSEGGGETAGGPTGDDGGAIDPNG